MHFTREPIIETIITPREGYKLILRSSKIEGSEEYLIDALEIVSFGNAHFYRSTEKPKSFLVSITDFEVVEVRETKVALKTASPDRGIKIGGGKKEPVEEVPEESSEEEARPTEKKRERKRGRRRRTRSDEETATAPAASSDPYDTFMEVTGSHGHEKIVESPSEAIVPPSHSMNILIPPPSTLISESFGRLAKESVKGEEPALSLPEAPHSHQERVEELIDDITED